MDAQPLGTRVRELRRRRKMTQSRLAKELQISPSYLNLIEHDKRNLTAPLLIRAAEVLGVDLKEFSGSTASALSAEVRAIFDDPLFDGREVMGEDVKEVVTRYPAMARAFADLYRALQESRETAEALASRVVGGDEVTGVEASRLPSEEVSDLIQRSGNYFEELEDAAEEVWQRGKLDASTLFDGLVSFLDREHGVRVKVVRSSEDAGAIRRFDPKHRVLHVSEVLPPRSRHFQVAHQLGLLRLEGAFERLIDDAGLTEGPTRVLGRMVLANYFAGALLLPYTDFQQAAEAERYDVELLGHRFRTSFEQVCHRLTTLRRPGAEGVPFHLVKTDTAGNISKRFSASGIHFARFSGGCPRWNVNAAFMTPGRIRVQVSEMPDGARYFCLARTVTRRHGGYHAPETVHAIGLGCRLEYAEKLVYADGVDLADERALVSIGVTCRLCQRQDCEQRAFPAVHQPLELDANVRGVSFYSQGRR